MKPWMPIILLSMIAHACLRINALADDAALRWQPAIDKFLAADADQPFEPGGVVFVGSSSIRFWDLERSFPSLDALNRGFGGSQVSDSLHYLDELVLKHKPRLAVLYAGDNDIAAGESAEQVFADVEQFVRRVHEALPDARIAYLAIKPSIARWKLVDEMRSANEMVRTLATSHEALIYVDVFHPTLGQDGRPREDLFIRDGLHLNQAGYDLWADVLNRAVGDLAPAHRPKQIKQQPLQPIEDDPALPRVLIIGDSISIGYTIPVRKRLAGVANVHRIPANGGPTTRGIENIDDWLGTKPWDVIHFNWGLHDLRRDTQAPQVSIEDYEQNLNALVSRLKKTGAKLIWAATTPVPPGAAKRVPGDAAKYNEIAARVMVKHDVEINDLYSFALERLDAIQREANGHFTAEGNAVLADVVAARIRAALPGDESK